MKQARLRKETFSRPQGFSVEKYIDPSFGVYVNEDAVDIARERGVDLPMHGTVK